MLPIKKYTKKGFRNYYKSDFPAPIISRRSNGVLSTNPQYFKYYVSQKDKSEIVASRISENHSTIGFSLYAGGASIALLSLDKVKYLADFLDKKLLKQYQYNKEKVVMVDNEPCYVINFYPKNTNKKVHQGWHKKVKYPIYAGNLFISIRNFAIVKIDCQFSEQALLETYKSKHAWQTFPNLNKVQIKYAPLKNGKWCLSEVYVKQVIKPKPNNSRFSSTYELERFLKVVNYDKNRADFNENIQDIQRFNLRDYPIDYDANFWKTYEVNRNKYPKLSDKQKTELEQYKPLSLQFPSWFNHEIILPPIPYIKQDSFKINDNSYLHDEFLWLENKDDTLVQKAIFAENEYFFSQIIPYNKKYRASYKKLSSIVETCDDEIAVAKYSIGIDSIGEYGLIETHKNGKKELLLSFEKELGANNKLLKIESSPDSSTFLFEIKSERGKELHWKKRGNKKLNLIQIVNTTDYFWLTNEDIIYLEEDSLYREFRVYKYNIVTQKNKILFESKDKYKWIEIFKQSDSIMFINHLNHENNELFLFTTQSNSLKAIHNTTLLNSFAFFLDTDEQILLLAKEKGKKQSIYKSNSKDTALKRIALGKENQFIDDFLVTKDFFLLKIIENGQLKLLLYNKNKLQDGVLLDISDITEDFTSIELDKKSSYGTNTVVVYFSSINKPDKKYTLFLDEKRFQENKKYFCFQKGVQEEYYKTEMINVPSQKENLKIPVRITWPNKKRKNKGILLRVYGAYGAFNEPRFDLFDYFLLQQGYAVAQVHIRGSRALGYDWYHEGKLLKKKNGINDYIDVAKFLKEKNYTKNIIAFGQSAGGLIVGAALNNNADIFNAAILDYPYLDAVRTLTNEALPLTSVEYSEWGNPEENVSLKNILSYSPFQNIQSNNYPPTFLIGGLYDYQTPYWQMLKTGLKYRLSDTDESNKHFLLIEKTRHADKVKFERRKQQYIYMFLFMDDLIHQ